MTAQETDFCALPESGNRSNLRRLAPFLLVASDILAFIVSVMLGVIFARSVHIKWTGEQGHPHVIAHLGLTLYDALPVALCMLLYFIVANEYRARKPFWSEFGRLIAVSFYALLAAGFFAFAFKLDGLRIALVLPWLLFPFIAQIGRQTCRRFLHRCGAWQIPTLFIGSDVDEKRVCTVLNSEALPSNCIVGRWSSAELMWFLDNNPGSEHFSEYQLLICIDPGCPSGVALVERLTRRRISFRLIPHMVGLPVHSLSQNSYFSHDTIVLTYRSNLEEPALRIIKRTFDIIAASFIFALALPVFIILYCIIAIDGGQPIYGHRRIGLGGREFRCLKFRSMARNSDEILKKLLASDPVAFEEWSRMQKLSHDPRITGIGRITRKTSLDELPQLLNVLRGDMSLVGPRPIVEDEVRHYGQDIDHYYGARPGITGLWQVSGRSDTGYAARVELDRWYVRNWTLWHDIAILAKTIPAVLQQRGAR